MTKLFHVMSLLAVLFFGAIPCRSAEPEPKEENAFNKLKAMPNVPAPTLGGTQWWSDQYVFRDWRIQRHYSTGHYRLLDGNNIRHALGFVRAM